MAALVEKRKAKENKGKEKPKSKGPAPPLKRFRIWPGHRWDGGDGSRGAEQQRCARSATRRELQELTHQWNTQDTWERAPGVTHGHPPAARALRNSPCPWNEPCPRRSASHWPLLPEARLHFPVAGSLFGF